MVESLAELERSVGAKSHEWMTELVKQEVSKLLKENKAAKEGSIKFLTSDFAGMASNHNFAKIEKGTWILDT